MNKTREPKISLSQSNLNSFFFFRQKRKKSYLNQLTDTQPTTPRITCKSYAAYDFMTCKMQPKKILKYNFPAINFSTGLFVLTWLPKIVMSSSAVDTVCGANTIHCFLLLMEKITPSGVDLSKLLKRIYWNYKVRIFHIQHHFFFPSSGVGSRLRCKNH